MSRIAFEIKDGNIRFFRPVTEIKPFDAQNALGREEYLAFLLWLKENINEEDLPHDFVTYRLLNRYSHDRREDRIKYLRAIKKSESAEEAYRAVASILGQCCAPRALRAALEAPLDYIEDLYAFLRNKVDEKAAALWTGIIAAGEYKAYARQRKREQTLYDVCPELDAIARTVKRLPDRAQLTRLFGAEYERFQKEYRQECLQTTSKNTK